MKIKGTNGVVFDVDDQVAYGLVDAGHAEAVDPLPEVEAKVYLPATDTKPDPDLPNSPQPKEVTAATTDGDATPEAPAGNASAATWREYALSTGVTAEQIEGLSRDEIRDYVANR